MTSSVLSAVLGILTLVATLSSAVAVAKANLAKSTIDTLKESNDALKEQSGIQAAEILRLRLDLTALERENEVLRGLASGSEAVERWAAGLGVADNARKTEHHDILASIQAQQAVWVASHEEVLSVIRASIHTHGGSG